MNRERALLWAEDLESGLHRQTRKALHAVDDEGDCFCCLGRLTEAARADGVELQVRVDESHRTSSMGRRRLVWYRGGDQDNYLLPPQAVCEWLGVELNQLRKYASLNDSKRMGFLEIAAVVRADAGLPERVAG